MNTIKEFLCRFWPAIILTGILGFLVGLMMFTLFPLWLSAYIGVTVSIGFSCLLLPPRSLQSIGIFVLVASSFIWVRPSYYNHHTPVVEQNISPLAMGIKGSILWFVIPTSNDVTILRTTIATNKTMEIYEIQQVFHTNRYGKAPYRQYEIVRK